MLLRKGRWLLPSKEIRKGARLMALTASDGYITWVVMIISLKEMKRLTTDNTKGRPIYAAVDPVINNIVVYPEADRDYHISQRWQLEYEVA